LVFVLLVGTRFSAIRPSSLGKSDFLLLMHSLLLPGTPAKTCYFPHLEVYGHPRHVLSKNERSSPPVTFRPAIL